MQGNELIFVSSEDEQFSYIVDPPQADSSIQWSRAMFGTQITDYIFCAHRLMSLEKQWKAGLAYLKVDFEKVFELHMPLYPFWCPLPFRPLRPLNPKPLPLRAALAVFGVPPTPGLDVGEELGLSACGV